jgi:signal transduction histidine kinase
MRGYDQDRKMGSDPANGTSERLDNIFVLPGARVESGPVTVAVVEDDYEDFVLAKKNLDRVIGTRYVITTADSLEAGIELLNGQRFDVALIDFRIGGESGLDLVRAVGGRRSPTPLILLTGMAERETDVKAMEAGVFDFIDKSEISPKVMERAIRYARHTHALEVRLHQAVTAMEQAYEAKSTFLARVSHDLRTPLNAVLGFSEVIRDRLLGPDDRDKYREYAADIHASASHLLGLIDDILDLNKLEAGKTELALGEVDVAAAIAEALRLIAHEARQRGVTIASEPPGGRFTLMVDAGAFRRMLLNLLSNAVKFTPKGGAVGISAGLVDDGFRIAIIDTGVGIPVERLDDVIRPFEQSEASADIAHGGVGLGLSIVQSLIELHGGALKLSSAPGRGTTAALIFPASSVSE